MAFGQCCMLCPPWRVALAKKSLWPQGAWPGAAQSLVRQSIPHGPRAAPAEAVLEAFVRLHEAGLIYRGSYLVNWSPNMQVRTSALRHIAHLRPEVALGPFPLREYQDGCLRSEREAGRQAGARGSAPRQRAAAPLAPLARRRGLPGQAAPSLTTPPASHPPPTPVLRLFLRRPAPPRLTTSPALPAADRRV